MSPLPLLRVTDMREIFETRDAPREGDLPHAGVMDALGVAQPDRAKVRRAVLTTDDYYKVKTRIYYTPEGVAKLERWKEAPEIASEFFDARVKGPTNRPGFIWIEDPDKPGSVAPCMVLVKDWKMMKSGGAAPRGIRVERIEDVKGVSWAHERLAVKAGN